MKKLFKRNLDKDIAIVAELGINHEGSLERAVNLVTALMKVDVDAVKLQSYTVEKYCSKSNQDRYNMLKKFSLSVEDHIKLSKIIRKSKKSFFSTALTEDWVDFISKNGDAIKIASGDITYKEVIKKAAMQKKPVILSTGASDTNDIKNAIRWFKKYSIKSESIYKKLALLHCVSNYPADNKECNLQSIPFLKNKFNLVTGWSNHVIGNKVNMAAVALGAQIIEIHVTDKKNFSSFRDHSLSFEINELKQVIEDLRYVKKAIGDYKKEPVNSELKIRKIIRKGLISKTNIKKGEIFTKNNIEFARPIKNFSSNDISDVIGCKSAKNIKKGYEILSSHLKRK